MVWKKFGKALLFPHIAIMIILIPIATVFLVYSMVFLGTESPVSIVSYVLAFYTLTVWCFRLPQLIRFFKTFKEENKYARRWQDDDRLRVNVSLYGSLIWNTAYAVFQLGLGFWHRTFWFCSMAGYYIALAVMRFFLVRHTSKHKPGEKMRPDTVGYGVLYGVLEQNLSPPRNYNHYNGSIYLYRLYDGDHQYGKIPQI